MWQKIGSKKNAYVAGGNQYFSNEPHEPVGREFRAWGDVPPKNPAFCGRGELLERVHDEFMPGRPARVVTLHGAGGIGKTQLAAEYAHHYQTEYDVVWWIRAEQPDLIGEQMAELGSLLGFGELGEAPDDKRLVLMSSLAQHERWLMIFDNALRPEGIRDWLPGGAGNVLVTSRTSDWGEVARPIRVDKLARKGSVELLQGLVPHLTTSDAERIAHELGDLPLALAQAGRYIHQVGLPAEDYLALLASRAAEILDLGRPPSYPHSAAAVIQLAYDQLHREDPAAAQVAAICGFMAPEPIPARWFSAAARDLPPVLRAAAEDPMAWRQSLARLDDSDLARIEGGSGALIMHRVTQAVIRAHLPSGHTAAASAQAVLAASDPGDSATPGTWPEWARLLLHLQAFIPADSTPEFRQLAANAMWYLIRHGDADAGCNLAQNLYKQWSRQLGDDDADTLEIAGALAAARRRQGGYGAARVLDEDVLARRRRVLGEDHPDTLASLHSLAEDLCDGGDYQTARDLAADVLMRRRAVLGEDHIGTLASAYGLARCLYQLSEYQSARKLNEDTLARRRRVLGEDHPDTLTSASLLARNLAALGDHQAARDLDKDVLDRRRRILGANHPDTLQSAHYLAWNLHTLGNYRAAQNLDEDVFAGQRRVLGYDHPSTLWTASHLARNLGALGNHQAARDLDNQILARRRRVLGEDHPDTLRSQHNLARDLSELRDFRAAREIDEDTLARRRRVLGEDHVDTLWSAGNLARDLWYLGDYQAARVLDEDVLARRRRVLGEDHPDTLTAAKNLRSDWPVVGRMAAVWKRVRDIGP